MLVRIPDNPMKKIELRAFYGPALGPEVHHV
jgi:hypothetical protein